MLGEMGATLNLEIAMVVKNYKLNNNAKYMQAIKRTGPINTLSVYMDNRKEDSDKWNTNSFVNMDDPYWRDFYNKNYRSQDYHKQPSIYAWDYKENGFLDEIVDMKKLQRNI